jgi:glycosyltransferase involved in cell wall biosynthesis
MNYSVFASAAAVACMAVRPRPDVALVETPPLTVAAIGPLLRLRRVPYVLSVSDVWPQSAVDLGALTNARMIAAAERLERAVYRRASGIVGLTEGVCRLVGRSVPPEKIHLITNGIDPTVVVERSADASDGSFEVFYAGNMGLAQDLGTVIEAASLIRDRSIQFTFVGDGAARHQMIRRAEELKVNNARFLEAVPRDEILRLASRADAALVSLKDEPVLRGAVPMRLYDAMAARLPVVCSAVGEAARIVIDAGAGVVVSPGDPRALARAIEELRSSPNRDAMAERGRRFVEEHRDLRVLGAKMEAVLIRAAS